MSNAQRDADRRESGSTFDAIKLATEAVAAAVTKAFEDGERSAREQRSEPASTESSKDSASLESMRRRVGLYEADVRAIRSVTKARDDESTLKAVMRAIGLHLQSTQDGCADPCAELAIEAQRLGLYEMTRRPCCDRTRAETIEACAQVVQSMAAHTPGERELRASIAEHVRALAKATEKKR